MSSNGGPNVSNNRRGIRIDPDSPSGLSWSTGKHAGCLNKRGYWVVQLNKRQERAHRVVFCLHAEIPLSAIDGLEVDHKDQNKANNDPSNLRLATRSQNACNVSMYGNNCGHKNVYLTKYGTYRVNVSGQHRGTFKTLEEACVVAENVRSTVHGEFASA